MEGPLLTKSEHIVDITVEGNSSSIDNQIPHEDEGEESSDPYKCERFDPIVELVTTLIQIIPAIVVLIQPRDDEHPQTLLFIWIIGYTCGCIASLPIFIWRFWFYNLRVSESIEENSRETRINKKMDNLMFLLEAFFLAWFMVFLWNFMSNESSLDDTTTQFFWLCMALLSFSCIRHVLINLEYALLCLFMPGMLCVLAFQEVIMRVIGGICECFCP